MLRLILISLLAASGPALGQPIDLANALYSTAAYAELDGDSDGIHDDASLTSALPLFSHAERLGTDTDLDEFAHADALADDGFLSVSSEIQGHGHPASAWAEAALEHRLDFAGDYLLQLDFASLLDLVGGTAGATLDLVISAGSRTLFDESFSASAAVTRRFVLAPGESGLLFVGLSSSADSDGFAPGQLYAFNLATVDVALHAVPVPSPLALMAAGLLPLLRRRRAGAV